MQAPAPPLNVSHSDEGNFSPEFRLLLRCARVVVDEAAVLEIGALVRVGLNWSEFVAAAQAHRVLPLVYRTLRRHFSQAVPPATMALLDELYHLNARRSLLLAAELAKIIRLFGAAGIAVLPFKGPALGATVYQNVALRQTGDLDILVPEPVARKALGLLMAEGYPAPPQLEEAERRPFLQFRQFLEAAPVQRQYSLMRPDGCEVELHWAFMPRHFAFPLASEEMWSSLESIPLGGAEAKVLVHDDLILLLSAHGSKHGWCRLGWICDLAEALRASPVRDWDSFIRKAHRLGCRRMVYVGLLLARSLLDAPVPDRVLGYARRDAEAVRLARQAAEYLPRSSGTSLPASEEYRFCYTVLERRRDRLRYLVHLLETPTEADWKLLPLPSFLALLYYLIRPIRLTVVYLKRWLKTGTRRT